MTSQDALAKGRKVVQDRADYKRSVQGADEPRELLAYTLENELPDFLDSLTVLRFLSQAPRIGRDRAARLAERAAINPLSPLGVLTDRQRGVLAHVLKEH